MTLILGSSLGTTKAVWERNVPGLEQATRVVLYDHRGHGDAAIPPRPWDIGDLGLDVIDLMDRLEIERASVGGVSLGGMVAMWLGINQPERVEKLVLVCTTAHFPDPSVMLQRAETVRDAQGTGVIADAVVERWLTVPYAREHPETVDWLRAMVRATPAEGYAACAEAIARMNLLDELWKIRAPTLIIGAEQDGSTPPEHQQAIAQRITGARLEILPDAAHLANVERVDVVNELILEHLREG